MINNKVHSYDNPMQKSRPFLKWAGNKYRLLNQILPSLPKARRLIEPFAGSAALFINSDYPSYWLCEINNDLVELFLCVKNEGESFITYCETYFLENNNSETQYYLLRDKFNQSTDLRERAALFLYLNRHGYNGLCRYNSKGIFNVPFGQIKRAYFPRKEMLYFHKKSTEATFTRCDFRETFKVATSEDLIYCDPPYSPRSQSSNFSSYTDIEFGEKEHIELALLALEHTKKGGVVLISNHDTEFTRHHYQRSEIKSFPVQRFISCKGNHRLQVQEILAIFKPES